METVTLETKIAKLPENLKLKLESIVDDLLVEAGEGKTSMINAAGEITKRTPTGRPVFGSGKGIFGKMAEDFDEPLDQKKLQRKFGSLKGFVTYMADDFDAPLEEFKDYM